MKLTFVLAAITLALAALPVAAAERLPAKLVGNWCSVDAPKSEGEWIYNRTTTQCPIGTIARMKIRTDGMDEQDGTDGPSGKCQLLQMIVIKSDDYLAKLHCNSEGQISTEVKRLTLKGNRLVTSVVGEKNETTQADHANDPPPSVDKRCVVVDPTGTQLNVRTSPNGRIVGTIANGVTVSILDNSVDNRRKSWVYIGEYNSGKPVGWVFREFISCL